MKKTKNKKKKWLRGVFDTFPNASQYTGWVNGRGVDTMGLNKKRITLDIISDDKFKYISGPMKKWYQYESIRQLYDNYIEQSQPDGYLESLPLHIKKMVETYWRYDRDYSVAIKGMRDLYKEFDAILKAQHNKIQLSKEIKKLISLISTSGATPGFLTPHAFTKNGKTNKPKFLTKMGYKLVNELYIHSHFQSPQEKYEYYRKIIKKIYNIDILTHKLKILDGLSIIDNPLKIIKYPLKEILFGIRILKQNGIDNNSLLLKCLSNLLQDRLYYVHQRKNMSHNKNK